jgi:hypothetical protein
MGRNRGRQRRCGSGAAVALLVLGAGIGISAVPPWSNVLSEVARASAASKVVGGVATGFTQANGSTAGDPAGPLASFVESLLRVSPAAK